MPAAEDYLRKAFRHFAGFCEGSSPLYAEVSPRIADDPDILPLSGHGQDRQPPANLLFAAVHYLLLGGAEHPLAGFYPSLAGEGDPADAWPVFRQFCLEFRDQIIELVGTRRVQTNEVGRCGPLNTAFGGARSVLNRPLYLIEVGASAGLNLRFDDYRYEYADGLVCGPDSTVVIRTELRGPVLPPIEPDPPDVAGRVGIDIAPVDVTDPNAMRWVEALIWPDQLDRIELHRRAVARARRDPPRLVTGDGLDLVPNLIGEASASSVPCVYHSHATFQMSSAWRESFDEMLYRVGRDRDLAHISLEWLKEDPGPRLHLTTWSGGRSRTRYLADCHHHGRWMRWHGEENECSSAD